MPVFLFWTHHCFLGPPLCTLNPGEVSLSPFLLDILTRSCQGQSCCWGSLCGGASWGVPAEASRLSRLLCSLVDAFCVLQLTPGEFHAQFKKEMQAAPTLVPLSQHQLPLFSLPHPQGHRGLSRSMVQ